MEEAAQQGPQTTQTSNELTVHKRKFQNGWTPELEDLIADWADKAACYRWMHEKTYVQFKLYDQCFMIPIIVLSTLNGVANFGLDSILGETSQDIKTYSNAGIGAVSILAAILTTLVNFFCYAKNAEAHRVSAINWGKFNRFLCIEMRLQPDERTDSHVFLKMFRVELDRLVEQSPTIPDSVIRSFNAMFKNPEITKPEIAGIIERTPVFKDKGERLRHIAAEAALMLQHKKRVLKQLVLDDLNTQIRGTAEEVSRRLLAEERHKLQEILKNEKKDEIIEEMRKIYNIREPNLITPISKSNETSSNNGSASEERAEEGAGIYEDKWASTVDPVIRISV